MERGRAPFDVALERLSPFKKMDSYILEIASNFFNAGWTMREDLILKQTIKAPATGTDAGYEMITPEEASRRLYNQHSTIDAYFSKNAEKNKELLTQLAESGTTRKDLEKLGEKEEAWKWDLGKASNWPTKRGSE